MSLRNIILDPDPKLRKKSKKVINFDKSLFELLDDMKQTMRKAEGIGLAAVQVGVLKSVFIINYNGMQLEFINPEIIKMSGEQVVVEGCLSIKGLGGEVKRPKEVTIEAYDRDNNKFTLSVSGLLCGFWWFCSLQADW